MTLLSRRPRQVYRVYSEEEYLTGADPFTDWDAAAGESISAAGESIPAAGESIPVSASNSSPARSGGASTWPARTSRERRLRRLAGAAALTGAVGTVGTTIAVVGLRSHPAVAVRQVAETNVSTPADVAPSGIARSGVNVLPARVALPSRVTLRRSASAPGGGPRDGAQREVVKREVVIERSPRGVRVARPGVPSVPGTPGAGTSRTPRVMSGSTGVSRTQTVSLASRGPVEASSSAPSPEPQTAQETTLREPVADTAQSTPAPAAARSGAQSEFGFEH